MCESGGKGCMYTKHWFKQIFSLFLTYYFVKFVIPVVDFPLPHPNVISQVLPVRFGVCCWVFRWIRKKQIVALYNVSAVALALQQYSFVYNV
jgi:hypothetical protein